MKPRKVMKTAEDWSKEFFIFRLIVSILRDSHEP